MSAPLPVIERLELVTAQAATGDGGNSWGGHQTRIVRTRTGRLYTAYTVSTGADTARRWRLAERLPKGWAVLAEGTAGREPVNLLAGPDEQVHIVGWPAGLPHLWSVTRKNGKTAVREAAVPGAWARTDWPYGAAAINVRSGDLYVLQSNGDKPGELRWAWRQGNEKRWRFQVVPLAYRHCYAYVLPGAGSGAAPPLSLVATRDVRWETLGYAKPEKAFAYVFNAVTCWQSSPRAEGGAAPLLRETLVREEKPTARFPLAECGNAQTDAYVDTRGRLHVLYWLSGETTQGRVETRHAVLEGGRIINEVRLPLRGRPYCRLIQDRSGRFYLLSAEDGASELTVHPAVSEDGTSLGAPVFLSLKGHAIVYSGAAIACPRAGVPVEDYVDGVFPSGKGEQWVYFRLRLHGTSTGR